MNELYSIEVDQKTMIRMFFANQVNLETTWTVQQADALLDVIKHYSYEEILAMTDCIDYSQPLDTNLVPQFADMEAIDKAVEIVGNCGEDILSYEELGQYLIQEDRKPLAYRKYGENHGKGAALLGLITFHPGAFRTSCLTQSYNRIPTIHDKALIRTRLFLRIPFIQYTLFRARENRYNAYDSIRMFTVNTMERRGQSPRKIFSELHNCGCKELNKRINNIFWEA